MIVVEVPATSANCCLGFDSMGLAVDWIARFEFEPSKKLVVTGCDDKYRNEDNLVVQTLWKVCDYFEQPRINFSLNIHSDIPLARGLGSSSACVVAGILGAYGLFEKPLDYEQILSIATEIEGHPDNVAPALLGGLISCFSGNGKIYYNKAYLDDWKLMAIVPDYEIKTSDARKVLPENISLHEAAQQVGKALVFYEALKERDLENAMAASEDALHEPYRKELIVEYPYIQQLCDKNKALFWISGSGSTMLILAKEQETLDVIRKQAEKKYPALSFRTLSCFNKGARLWHE